HPSRDSARNSPRRAVQQLRRSCCTGGRTHHETSAPVRPIRGSKFAPPRECQSWTDNPARWHRETGRRAHWLLRAAGGCDINELLVFMADALRRLADNINRQYTQIISIAIIIDKI